MKETTSIRGNLAGAWRQTHFPELTSHFTRWWGSIAVLLSLALLLLQIFNSPVFEVPSKIRIT
jgi:hypothetical protein